MPQQSNESFSQVALVSSRYNFLVPVEGGVLLYNCSTGSVLKMAGADAMELGGALCRGVFEIDADDFPAGFAQQLADGGFLVASGTDELAAIRDRFWKARGSTPMVVTLTTTMNCNLGCYYCYESRSGERLHANDVSAIVGWVEQGLKSVPAEGLHIDWYGGEPMLNAEFIEAASLALQELCAKLESPYSASIISNGTAWPEDVGSFVARHRIRQAQISFDGLQENHDRRRRYRPGYTRGSSSSSFALAVGLVDRLLDHTRVDLRVNLDRYNQNDLLPFVAFATSRGWFSKKFPAVIQPARLASFSERSSFMRKTEMSVSEYDGLRQRLRDSTSCDVLIEESEIPDGFPYPKTSVCAALAGRSFVVGADGLAYRCGLQVGEKQRAVGRVAAADSQTTEVSKFADKTWWDSFDPTVQPSCSRCSFLPICWGGCPKKHLEGDAHALHEQSIYWRTNLPRLVASRFGLTPADGFNYTEADQFR